MQKHLLILFISFIGSVVYGQNVGIGTNTPDASAKLDITSTNSGLLVPRVALSATTTETPITSPATSLLIYNTATVNDVTPGYYYWNGSAWERLLTGSASSGWSITGNSGTTAGTNFIGTTDAVDFVTKVNNTERMRILSTNGYVGIGTVSPLSKLTVNDNITGVFPGVPGITVGNPSGNSFLNIGRNSSNYLHFAWLGLDATGYADIYASGKPLILNRSGFGGKVGVKCHSTFLPETILDVRGSTVRGTTAAAEDIFQIATPEATYLSLKFRLKTDVTATNRYAAVQADDAGTQINFTIQPDGGNVGIGTITPNYTLDVNGDGRFVSELTIGSYTLPATDGTNGQALTTDGAGNVTWQSVSNPAGWSLTGNSGTVAGTNFIGTTDATDFVAKTNNVERIRLLSTGNFAIGSTVAPAKTTILGTGSSPSIPGSTSTGILRVANGTSEAMDMGKMSTSPYAAWIQVGFNGTTADPLTLQPSGGNLGIGLTNPGYQLHLSTDNAAKPGTNTWTIASDRNLKSNIEPFKDGLAVLSQIEPVWFNYNGKAGLPTEKRYVGIIAQDIQRVAPYMIGKFIYQAPDTIQDRSSEGPAEEYLDYDGNAMTYIIINAIKEQQQIISTQQTIIEEQQKKLEELEQRLDALQE